MLLYMCNLVLYQIELNKYHEILYCCKRSSILLSINIFKCVHQVNTIYQSFDLHIIILF